MKKSILFTALALISFVFFTKAQDVQVSSSSKSTLPESEKLYFKIEGLQTVDDAAKLDDFLKTFEYVLNSKTIFVDKTCIVETKVGNSLRIRDAFILANNKLGYIITAVQVASPLTGTGKKK